MLIYAASEQCDAFKDWGDHRATGRCNKHPPLSRLQTSQVQTVRTQKNIQKSCVLEKMDGNTLGCDRTYVPVKRLACMSALQSGWEITEDKNWNWIQLQQFLPWGCLFDDEAAFSELGGWTDLLMSGTAKDWLKSSEHIWCLIFCQWVVLKWKRFIKAMLSVLVLWPQTRSDTVITVEATKGSAS